MKVLTKDLMPPALDWAVWVAVGGADAYPKTRSGSAFLKLWNGNSAKYVHPSTEWGQGGIVIEREGISVEQTFVGPEGSFATPSGWRAYRHVRGGAINPCRFRGPTPLIAVCRCYVASRLGEEVEVPEELL